jgi:hypothetical protein
MSERTVVVAAHGHCFDGLVSAALFTHLHRSLEPGPCRYRYLSCGYGPNLQVIPAKWLRGDDNAIVDFRYSPAEKLGWYFDHHPTGFSSTEELETARQSSARIFFEPSYDSCARLVADTGRKEYSVDFERFGDVIAWADRIDAARFETVDQALDRAEPMMQLAAVIEQHGQPPLFEELITALASTPAAEVAGSELVQKHWLPLARAHDVIRRRVSQHAELRGAVVYVDLHDMVAGSGGKFFHYAAHPEATYSVSLIRMKQHYKLSVGYNPWAPSVRRHDIAEICRRYGGGGHAEVGAIAFSLDRLEEARTAASAVVEELNQ